MPSKPPKQKASGAYPVGYCKPPQAHQFKPGQSGNPEGRPKGRPSMHQLLIEEVGRMVHIKRGDELIPVQKERALMRKLIDLALQGDMGAMRLAAQLLSLAHAAEEVAGPAQAPLTDDELATLQLLVRSEKLAGVPQ